MEPAPIVCFECAKPVGDPPALNTLPDGRSCRCCADRVLASQPGIFHEPWVETSVENGGEVLEGPWARPESSSVADGLDPEPA